MLSLMIGSRVSAQEFNFGVKAGIALNRINWTNLIPGDRVVPNVGFYAGVAGNLDLSDLVFGQMELLYARKGINTRSEIVGKYSRNISYLQLPVFLGFKIGSDDGLRLMLGPEFGFCVGERISGFVDNKKAVADMAAPFNLAIAVQVNYMFTEEVGLDFKVDMGITKTFRDEKQVDNGRNLSLQLGLCYFF